ncbi:MAG: DinB family protein [Gemmatimonadota bacterium]
MESAIELLRQTRPILLRLMDGLSEAQLLEIPHGFRNNILWNVGHVVVSQQGLHYRMSGLDQYVSDEQVAQFRKGSDPADWKETPDVGLVKKQLTELADRLMDDYRAGRFTRYQEYPTSTGPVLRSIGDAIAFNNYHEGYHTGIVMAQRRLVR